jgi:hypothetical protein
VTDELAERVRQLEERVKALEGVDESLRDALLKLCTSIERLWERRDDDDGDSWKRGT